MALPLKAFLQVKEEGVS